MVSCGRALPKLRREQGETSEGWCFKSWPGKFKLILAFIIDVAKITSHLRSFESSIWCRPKPHCHERTDHNQDNVDAETIVPLVAPRLAVAVHYLSSDVSKVRHQRVGALKFERGNLK